MYPIYTIRVELRSEKAENKTKKQIGVLLTVFVNFGNKGAKHIIIHMNITKSSTYMKLECFSVMTKRSLHVS